MSHFAKIIEMNEKENLFQGQEWTEIVFGIGFTPDPIAFKDM